MGRAGSSRSCGLLALLRVSWAESFCGASMGLCQCPCPEALWVPSGSERHVPLSPSQEALHLGAKPQQPLNLPVVLRCLIIYRDQFYQVEQELQSIDLQIQCYWSRAGVLSPKLLPSFTFQELQNTQQQRRPQELTGLAEPGLPCNLPQSLFLLKTAKTSGSLQKRGKTC